MLAVLPIRAAELPLGGDEAVAEAGGRCLLMGSGVTGAAGALEGLATTITCWEAGHVRPGAWATALAEVVAGEELVVLPGNPDGRDLAPRLSAVLGWPLVAWAHRIDAGAVTVARHDGRSERDVHLDGPTVVTLRPGCRGVVRGATPLPDLVHLDLPVPLGQDAELVAELAPDPATMDLAEARRIVAGGAGLGGRDEFELLGRIGRLLGASLGATRVATDAGWTDPERQIGTTGVTVDPGLYLAFGISGAVQHLMGLGDPNHVISVNLDPSCPMTAMADLAVVSDARQVLAELAVLLGAGSPGGAGEGS